MAVVAAWQGGAACSKAWHGSVLGLCVCVPATSWSPRVAARHRRGSTAAGQGQGSVANGLGAHAHARVLASRVHGVAMACAGHPRFGAVARRGGGEVTAVAGRTSGTMGSCNKDGTKAGTGAGGPRAELRKAQRRCRQHKGDGERWRSSLVKAWGDSARAAERRGRGKAEQCRGARGHQCR
jgi:hypothetical protein